MGVMYKEANGEVNFSSEVYPNSYMWSIKNLKPDTKYVVRVYLRNCDTNTISYSEPQVFRTLREDDRMNSILEFTTVRDRSDSERIYASHKLVKKGSRNLDGIVIRPDCCFQIINNGEAYNGIRFDEDYIVENSWRKEYDLATIDYTNHTADGEYEALIKYAYSENPNEWYWTKIPIKLHYTTAPELSEYTVLHSSEEMVEFTLNGAFWIESITMEAELWETIQYWASDGTHKMIEQKVDERTFVIKPEDIRYYGTFSDGYNKFVPWPAAVSDVEHSFDVIVKNATINLKK